MRKRASTVSAPLEIGQAQTTTIWTHDHTSSYAADVVINLSSWPGLAKGDVVQVTRAGTDPAPGESFMFLVGDDTVAGPKSNVPHISILRDIANKFNLSQNMDVKLTKIDPATVSASLIEVYFRDMYLGRRDMWLMISHITDKPVYVGQKINFFSSQGAIIKNIYIDSRQVSSAMMTAKTRTTFRSLSARSNLFISVCRELWEFLEDGERYYEKIVHSFLPSLINKWRESSIKHVVAIILFSRVYYDQSELDFAAGPLVRDGDGNWYKDFYKVVVDLEILKDWKPVLVTLKRSFLEFQRDILFNHHYHQNLQRVELQNESNDSLQRLVGRLSYAQDSPILEAINLGLNPTDLHYVDRSLSLTGCSTIIVTPGSGRFRVPKNLLQFTTMRLLDQGFSVDLVCLNKSPLHLAPIFSFESEDPDLLVKDSRRDGHLPAYGSFEMDPLWSTNEKNVLYEKKEYHWEPFWLHVSWWDIQADMPFRPDRFVPRAKMHEIQTLGLLDHHMVASIEIPFTKDPAQNVEPHGSAPPREARKSAREEFDRSVFTAVSPVTMKSHHPPLDEFTPRATEPAPEFSRGSPMPPPAVLRSASEKPRPRHTRKSSESLVDGAKSNRIVRAETPITMPLAEREPRKHQRGLETSPSRRSHSRDSVRSIGSISEVSRSKMSLASRFPGSAWLFGGLRSPSSPSTSHVEAISGRDESPRLEVGESSRGTASSALLNIQSKASNVSAASEPIAIPLASTMERPPSGLPQDSVDPVPAIIPRVPRLSPFHILNPSKPLTLSRTNSALGRCWQHVFHGPTFTHDIKWVSMCAPACLPLTTEHYASEDDLMRDYVDYTYDVYITDAVRGSFLLRQDSRAEKTDWARLVLREMIATRLVQGFQLIVKDENNKGIFDPNQETLSKMIPSAFPIGVADVLPSTSHPIYLSIGSQLHRLLYEPIENVIRVSRFVRRDAKRSVKFMDYSCLVWPKLGQGYTKASTRFNLPDFDAYGWNRLDRTINGYQRDFGDLVRYWRTRYLIIPSEEPPMERYVESGFKERLSDEECRLLGINRLALLFHQSRWLAPEETKETYTVPQFLPTTLDPAACVLDEDLMAQLDESNATAATGQRRISDKDLEGMSLHTVAQLMRDEPSLIHHHQWHGTIYLDSFTGRQWVSWAVRAFRDVSTREEAEERGAQLCKDGLFVHVNRDHGFMDGHYYYQLCAPYAGPPRRHRRGSRWFSASRSSSKEANSSSDPGSTLSSSIMAVRAGTLKPRKKHTLSQTVIIHADYRKRSTQAENLILHHDVIQNPGTAFHFEFNWIGTAGRCIEDLLKYWSNTIAPYGLRLVEGYVDPIVDITKKNIFQSCFPIPLAVAPPHIQDIRERLPPGSSSAWYFEYAILRKFGYILDIEAEQSYAETVDVTYSYRRASFRQSQFVHQSGRAFVQVMGGSEGFKWVTNRLLAASTAFPVGGPEAKNEATPHEKAAVLRLDLLAFCSDLGRLERFYEEVIANLPPARSAGAGSDEGDDSE